MWYNSYTSLDALSVQQGKEREAAKEPETRDRLRRGREIFAHPYYLDKRSDDPEQHRAIGWAKGRMYTLIFEVREDRLGEYYHLVTLWRATREEKQLYEANK